MKPILIAAITAAIAIPAVWDYADLRDRVVSVASATAQAATQATRAAHVAAVTQSDPHTEIVRMMDSSAAAWNRGDLDRFVADYAPDTTTTFVGSKGILRGRAAIRGAYAPRFTKPGSQDSLSFEQIEVDALAPDVANVIAFYRLSRGDSTIARGPTSLVMRRIGGHWKIIHDHSS